LSSEFSGRQDKLSMMPSKQLKDPLGIEIPEELLDQTEHLLLILLEKVEYIIEQFQRYEPLLEKYERASKANSAFARRKIFKGLD